MTLPRSLRWRLQSSKKQRHEKAPQCTARPDFDVEGFSYRDTDAPFVWKGKSYLCKVIVSFTWKREHGDYFNKHWGSVAKSHHPQGEYQRISNGWQNYVLFADEDDAKTFLALFADQKALIEKVYRPESRTAADAMNSDRRIRVRNALYFTKFGYVVTLNPRRLPDENIHVRLRELLGGDTALFRITNGVSVRVYLTEERHIVLVRLAYGEAVTWIERVVLRGTFRDAHGTSEGACRQGSDSPRN